MPDSKPIRRSDGKTVLAQDLHGEAPVRITLQLPRRLYEAAVKAADRVGWSMQLLVSLSIEGALQTLTSTEVATDAEPHSPGSRPGSSR